MGQARADGNRPYPPITTTPTSLADALLQGPHYDFASTRQSPLYAELRQANRDKRKSEAHRRYHQSMERKFNYKGFNWALVGYFTETGKHTEIYQLMLKHGVVDIGSGKGWAAFVFALDYNCPSVRCVELNKEYIDIHKNNIAAFKENNKKLTFVRGTAEQQLGKIEFFHTNAADYKFDKNDSIIYMFNPFGPKHMRVVMRRLKSSLRKHPRPCYVIYQQPGVHLVPTIIEHGFKTVHEQHRLMIFKWRGKEKDDR